MVSWGCAVWGTGWYYPPYVGWRGHQPVYYPGNPSYGYGAWYSPSAGMYSPGAAQAWNPRSGTGADPRQGATVYASWEATAVERGDRWAQASRVANKGTGTIARTGSGNVFAGHDGNVYRNEGGSWQRYDNGGWSRLGRLIGTSGELGDQLNRDFAARRDGDQRTSSLDSSRWIPGWRRAPVSGLPAFTQ
jgi:hypothetical protein